MTCSRTSTTAFAKKFQETFEVFGTHLLCYVMLLRGQEESKKELEGLGGLESLLVKLIDTVKVKAEHACFETDFVEKRLLQPLFYQIGWKFGSPKTLDHLIHIANATFPKSLTNKLREIARKMQSQAEMISNSNRSSRKNSVLVNEPVANLTKEQRKVPITTKEKKIAPSPMKEPVKVADRKSAIFNLCNVALEKTTNKISEESDKKVSKLPEIMKKISKPEKKVHKRSIKTVLETKKLVARKKSKAAVESTIDQSQYTFHKQEKFNEPDSVFAEHQILSHSHAKDNKNNFVNKAKAKKEFVIEDGDFTICANWENEDELY